jgi:hypothetical protein
MTNDIRLEFLKNNITHYKKTTRHARQQSITFESYPTSFQKVKTFSREKLLTMYMIQCGDNCLTAPMRRAISPVTIYAYRSNTERHGPIPVHSIVPKLDQTKHHQFLGPVLGTYTAILDKEVFLVVGDPVETCARLSPSKNSFLPLDSSNKTPECNH